MAGAATSDSRLGLTLQGYDQVIALSQANINESLDYHFTAKPELCVFEASIKTPYPASIKGKIKPPSIELVDIENADQALYCLTFTSGDYKAVNVVADGVDEDGFDKVKTVKINKPLKGWKLAFYVSFSMQRMETIPDEIRAQIQLPGLYSVEQLLVDFGTADLLTWDWGHSKITGFDDENSLDGARNAIQTLTNGWLTDLKKLDSTQSHNIIGHAVKVEPKDGKSIQDTLSSIKDSTGLPPSFPPTALRLQTINHRPGGDEKQTSTSNDHNAFLFTEMTGGRKMISKDLEWSGDWFYDSIGGTIAMSKGIFWDQYLLKILQPVNVTAVQRLNTLAKVWARPGLPEWLISDSEDIGDAPWEHNGVNSFYKWHAKKTTTRPDRFFVFQLDCDCTVDNTLSPMIGAGSVQLLRKFHYKSTAATYVVGGGFRAEIKVSMSAEIWDQFEFRSVDQTGSLRTDYRNISTTWPDPVIEVNLPSTDSFFGALQSETKERTELAAKEMVMASLNGVAEMDSSITTALNKQGGFVFPGGGTFDIKDPIFSKAGDLLIGLTYRKGDANGVSTQH